MRCPAHTLEARCRSACGGARRSRPRTARSARPQQGLRLAGKEAFALGALAGQLAGAADGFGLLARLLLGRLFVMPAKLHFAENALALHLLLQRLEGLIDIIVADENLHACSSRMS